MSPELTEAQKLDILLGLSKEYNLKEVPDDPATYTMDCGKGYTLFASVIRSWYFKFDDGIGTVDYDIESSKVPFTNAKDSRTLYGKYQAECKRVLDELKGETKQEEQQPVDSTPVTSPKFDPVIEEKNRLEREANEKRLAAMEAGEIEKPESKPVQRSHSRETAKNERRQYASSTKAITIPDTVRSKQISALTQEDIKNYLCQTATDQEAYMFLQLCQARNLNPFIGEAYLIKYGNKATMVVGKEAYMRRAEAHPQFDGFEAGIIIKNEIGEIERREGTFIMKGEILVGGWAKVYRKDRKQAFVSEVSLDEYNTKQSLWVAKPATMIRKVALVQCKREAFPSEFGGMYDAAEMGGDVIEAVYQEVEA